jgi:hypothetical protein
MKHFFKSHRGRVSESRQNGDEDIRYSKMEMKEKLIAAGIYILIMVITIALMLILFNVLL